MGRLAIVRIAVPKHSKFMNLYLEYAELQNHLLNLCLIELFWKPIISAHCSKLVVTALSLALHKITDRGE